ncbi:MAG: hypothetical protein AAF328_07615 [Planctomycetota bacterium]
MTPTPAPTRLPNHTHTMWRLGLVAALVVLGMVYARIPLSPDQFAIQYVAWRVNQGDPLYTGVIDMNWPGIITLMRPIASLPFDPWFPWRVLDFAVMLLGVAATARLLDKAVGVLAARIWWLVYPLLYVSPALYWFAGQPDAVMMHVTLIAVAIHGQPFTRAGGTLAVRAGAIGVVMGLAALIKPTAVCFAIALVLHAGLIWVSRQNGLRNLTTYVAAAACSGIFTLAAGFTWVMLAGARPAEVQLAAWTYNHTAQFAGQVASQTLAVEAASWLLRYWHLGLPFVAMFVFHRERSHRTPTRSRMLVLLLLLAALGSYALQRKGFAYHLAPAWTVLSIMFCVGVSVMYQFARQMRSWPIFLAAFVFLVYFASLKTVQLLPVALNMMGLPSRVAPLSEIQAGDQTDYATLQQINDTLTPLLDPGDPDAPLLVWGETVAVNLMQQRLQPTPFYYFLTLTNLRTEMPMYDPWLNQFSEAMQAAPYADIALISNEAIELAEHSGNRSFVEISKWINEADIVAEFGNIVIMRRRRAMMPAPTENPEGVGEAASSAP